MRPSGRGDAFELLEHLLGIRVLRGTLPRLEATEHGFDLAVVLDQDTNAGRALCGVVGEYSQASWLGGRDAS